MSNMSFKKIHHSNTSIFSGAMIIAATIVGVGMFSLPIVMAGSWFFWGTAILIFTWFCMLMSGLMILETSLHYPVGSSFNTFVKDLLGNNWNILNGISVAFVLYILTYAYISASGSILSLTARDEFELNIPPRVLGALFSFILAFIVWLSTTAVSRAASFVLGVKILTFFLTFGSLLFKIEPVMLFNDIEKEISYLPFVLIIFPFCLTSFGFHGNVPSLIIHYGKSPKLIFKALLYGTLIALFLYIVWLLCAMGNIDREGFKLIIAQGGNMDSLVSALGGVTTTDWVKIILLIFSNFAVASSFLGVTLGLFDYIADLFKFNNSSIGRCKTAFVTFLPPIIFSLLFPNGFLYAIGFAGLAATVFAVFIPGMLVLKKRKRFSNTNYQVWGGKKMVYLIFIFGTINILSFMLSSLNLLPIYQ